MGRITSLLCFFLLLKLQGIAQEEIPGFNPSPKPWHTEDIEKLSPLQRYEDSLVHVADSVYTNDIPEIKENANADLIRLFKATIKTAGSFNYTFSKLKDYISILDAPDKSFRIYNWEYLRTEGYSRYYGVIQKPDGGIIPLVDISDKIIRGAEDSIFNSASYRWFGCLYYNLIMREVAGQPVYFIFGRNSNNLNSDKKIIEPLSFNAKGEALFGAPVFTTLERGVRKTPNRFIYEYQRGSVLSLNFDPETNQIIFDHCESQIGDPAKKFTYIPDGTYDGMRWDGAQWVMQENIVSIQTLQNGEAPVEKPIK